MVASAATIAAPVTPPMMSPLRRRTRDLCAFALGLDALDVLEEHDLVVERDVRAVDGILLRRLPQALAEHLGPDSLGHLAGRCLDSRARGLPCQANSSVGSYFGKSFTHWKYFRRLRSAPTNVPSWNRMFANARVSSCRR